MMPRQLIRTAGMTAAMTVMLSGVFAGSAFAAYDDMDAVSLANKMVGKDFASGQESPSAGFDNGGLNYYVFKMLSYNMPRSLQDQFNMDKPKVASLEDVVVGDVLFFGNGGKPSFSGIYVGDGKIVRASASRDEVVTSRLSEYKNHFIGGRRILLKKDRVRASLILNAQDYLGTPYDFGARYGQTNTFDCSSFTKWMFNKYGITLPRVSRDQAKVGTFVSRSNLEAGDLVFFTTRHSNGRIGHVGIYVGDGMMIHTYGEGGVKFSTIESGWWDNHYVTARRVIQ